jgi:biopolymer transport protein ExbD
MLSQSFLSNQSFQSPLSGQSTLKPAGWRNSRPFMFALSLTSLIDAFSILVIYLLMNFGTAQDEIQIAKGLELPQATQSGMLENGPMVRIHQGRYYVDDREVTAQQITAALIQIKQKNTTTEKDKKNHLIIQADRRLDFKQLSPVIQAGSHAGYEKFKFAVLQEGAKQ